MNVSRITIEADSKAVALLTAEGLLRKKITARLTLGCIDAGPTKTALKWAADGVAARTVAASLPFFVTPAELLADLIKCGFAEDVAAAAVGQVVVTTGIREEREQHSDAYASEILTSHLVNVPHLGGIKAVHPTGEPAPVPAVEPTLPERAENPSAEGAWPNLNTQADDDQELAS